MSTGLAGYIKTRRGDLRIGATDLARAIGKSAAYVSQLEAGKIALPNADIRRRLAKELGVSHLDLLVAAGEIDRSEIASAGAAGVVQGSDTFRDLVEQLRAVPLTPGNIRALRLALQVLTMDDQETTP